MSRPILRLALAPFFLVALASCERACSKPSARAEPDAALASSSPDAAKPIPVGSEADAQGPNIEEVDAGDPGADIVPPAAPSLTVTTLARASEHLRGIGLSTTSVYVWSEKGIRQVARGGGALAKATLAAGDMTSVLDPAHSYWDVGDEHPYENRESTSGGDHFVVGSGAVLVHSDLGAAADIAGVFDAPVRKALVMRGPSSLAWLEPALHGVIGSDGDRASVRYVLDAWTPGGADIAFVADRVFLLDVRGRLVSAKFDGTDARFMGDVSKDLGAPEKVWIRADGTTLFVTSDNGDAAARAGLTADARILAIDLAGVAGVPLPVRNDGLVSAWRLDIADIARPDSWLRGWLFETFEPFGDKLKEGKGQLVLSLGGASSDASVDASLMRLESVIKADYGAKVSLVRAPVARGKPVARAVIVGFAPRSVASLLEP